jgi:rhodanese-related sulfurtransferase
MRYATLRNWLFDLKEVRDVRRFWILLAFLLLFLAACGGATTAPDTTQAALDLAPTVSVDTVADIKERDDVVVLDVREQWEYDAGHIPGVTLIPLAEVPDRVNEIPTDKTVIVTCRTGNRSGQATDYLRALGYENVHNMDGGIVAWEAAGLPVEQ